MIRCPNCGLYCDLVHSSLTQCIDVAVGKLRSTEEELSELQQLMVELKQVPSKSDVEWNDRLCAEVQRSDELRATALSLFQALNLVLRHVIGNDPTPFRLPFRLFDLPEATLTQVKKSLESFHNTVTL